MNFSLSQDLIPRGDQQQAIDKLSYSLSRDHRHQTLLGVTGSGKTFTMANLITKANKPTLVISHNKTLAAQLYSELKNFFPNNAVEYFVSYFDYYQPEAYIPHTDTYIEKDSSINDEIERLRLSTMGSLLTRKDVIVVASVSCIYGLGSPEDYISMMIPIHQGMILDRNDFLRRLVELLFERNDLAFRRGEFRVRGDVVEVRPAQLDNIAIRIEFFDDEIEKISLFNPLTGTTLETVKSYTFFPAKQFVSSQENRSRALHDIQKEMEEQIAFFEKHNKLIEAQRIKMRTEYDMEMLRELGFCQGVENYSRHLTGRQPGETPHTLLDFFPDGFMTLIDESHVSIPQIGGMYEGDRSRKTVLVEHGFRLPSALDNRPLKFPEFMNKANQLVYISATPGPFEFINSRADNKSYIPVRRRRPTDKGEFSANNELLVDPQQLNIVASGLEESFETFKASLGKKPLIVEQILRPTGLLDPILHLYPLEGQIDKTIELCHDRVAKHERVLITTLTKKTAEELTTYLKGANFNVSYIHADVDTIERIDILRSLRSGEIDVLVGINLLREGLDLPEVSLVCVLDADKEGFLRNETALLQTAGRAARHIHGECVLFCDTITRSIQRLIDITKHRRSIQEAYNKAHNITPHSIKRKEQESLRYDLPEESQKLSQTVQKAAESADIYAINIAIEELEEEMKTAAQKLEFERAADLRDQILKLKEIEKKQG